MKSSTRCEFQTQLNEVEAKEAAKGDGGCAGTDAGTVQTL
jgi:hypothetical protein